MTRDNAFPAACIFIWLVVVIGVTLAAFEAISNF